MRGLLLKNTAVESQLAAVTILEHAGPGMRQESPLDASLQKALLKICADGTVPQAKHAVRCVKLSSPFTMVEDVKPQKLVTVWSIAFQPNVVHAYVISLACWRSHTELYCQYTVSGRWCFSRHAWGKSIDFEDLSGTMVTYLVRSDPCCLRRALVALLGTDKATGILQPLTKRVAEAFADGSALGDPKLCVKLQALSSVGRALPRLFAPHAAAMSEFVLQVLPLCLVFC